MSGQNDRFVRLKGVRVHNLREVDLKLPLGRLIVLTGVSGSGKSSLALDTLYAEGQRRYIESFSAYTRQFLERLDRPDADLIEGIPPAIAIAQKAPSRSSRSTVGTVTEIADYLRLLFAKIGRVFCHQCAREVTHDDGQSVARAVEQLADRTRVMVTYPQAVSEGENPAELAAALLEDGFIRVVHHGQVVDLTTDPIPPDACSAELLVVVDRLVTGSASSQRLADSVETAFGKGQGRTVVLAGDQTLRFSEHYRCEYCALDFPKPEPKLYSFNSPLGACPACQGFGNIIDIDMDLVVPDKTKTLRDGAIAPWNTPAYTHELDELLNLADDYDIPVDVPFDQLEARHLKLIIEGVPEWQFGGLRGFFRWLDRKKYKVHVRVYLSRWRSYSPCPACHGARLQPIALCTRVGGKNIAEVAAMEIRDAFHFFDSLDLDAYDRTVADTLLHQVRSRLGYLDAVGLDYLTLDRLTRTLSGGEAQRVALTSALGSSLVNTLYVLDEPSIGLHKRDTHKLIAVLEGLRDAGNTAVVVEHDESVIRSADQVVDVGPGAGEAGGRIVFQGTPEALCRSTKSVTGAFLSGRRHVPLPTRRRCPDNGWIKLVGASGHNLKHVDVEIPLGVLCVVTGVSGSGKSTLVEDTLYPALQRRLGCGHGKAAPFADLIGAGQLDDVLLVDQAPVGRSPRSNPVTYIKAFDEIRRVFASTLEARTRGYGPGHFSFNRAGGRCNKCDGNGYLQIDMQFLADVFITCPECNGTRFRKAIREVKFRGRHIAEVLAMSVREAMVFFRNQPKIQKRLQVLIDVGLEYLRLGQPANTLSGGESQRLKLASHMATVRRRRTLFVLDEPTTGLHFADIVQLLDCFDRLVSAGHSLVVIEHNLDVIKSADYVIDLGPEAADRGGTIVAAGTPEEIAACPTSHTGRFLKPLLLADQEVARRA